MHLTHIDLAKIIDSVVRSDGSIYSGSQIGGKLLELLASQDIIMQTDVIVRVYTSQELRVTQSCVTVFKKSPVCQHQGYISNGCFYSIGYRRH